MLSYIVLSPGHVFLEVDGDSAKNYYTFIYHSMYGSGLWFDGMNYPYGEHLVFTDAQPVLVLISKIIPVHPLTIMHLLIALSYVLAIVVLYKILLRFKVQHLWALLSAVLITVMSPQVFRLTGHFSLAYVSFVPVLFYVTLCYHQSRANKYLLWLLLYVLFCSFIHIYYLAIIIFWVGSYALISFMAMKDDMRTGIKHAALPVLSVLIASGIFYICLLLTDHVADRPDYPSNTRAHLTGMADIFTSAYSPVWQFLNDKGIVASISSFSEGYTYIGLIPIIMIGLYMFRASVNKLTPKGRLFLGQQSDASVTPWLFIAMCMLFIASGIIFINCFECLDNAMLFRQFRALGRFSWPAYYACGITGSVILYRLYILIRMKNKYIAYVTIILALSAWGIEAYPYINYTRSLAEQGRDNYNTQKHDWKGMLESKGYAASDFQSVLYLPYVHVGSEKLGAGTNCNHLNKGFQAGLSLSLPLMDVMMSRTSWQQTFRQVKIEGGSYAEKTVLKELPNNKSILLLVDNDCTLDKDQQYLLQVATYISDYAGCSVYELYPAELLSEDKSYIDTVKNIAGTIPESDTCIGFNATWFIDHFNNGSFEDGVSDNAVGVVDGNISVVAQTTMDSTAWNNEYEFSAWIKMTGDNYRVPSFSIHCFDSSGSTLATIKAHGLHAKDSYGSWLRISKYFTIPESCTQVSFEIVNIPNPAYEALDELLLRPASSTVISKRSDGKVLVNNHIVQ